MTNSKNDCEETLGINLLSGMLGCLYKHLSDLTVHSTMVICTAVDRMIRITGNKGRTSSHSVLSVIIMVHVNTTLFSPCR